MNLVNRGAVVLLIALGIAIWTQVPPISGPDLGVGPDRAPTSSVACPVVTGRDATTDARIGAYVADDVAAITTSGGEVITTDVLEVDDAGGEQFDVAAAAGASTLAMILDLPEGGAGAAVVTRSDLILSAANCTPPALGEIAIAGVSTASGESLDLVLANPYANDAVVEVTTISEAGADSATELESVLVPARSVVTVDLATILPLRNRLSIRIVPERGVVHAAAIQSSGGERMVVEAVAAHDDWYLPIPDTGVTPIATVLSLGLEISYEVDAYTPEGVTRSVLAGTVGADAQASLDLSVLPVGTQAIRVSTSGDSVASVVIESDTLRAGTPGAAGLSPEWLVPGPQGEGGVLRMANPSEFEVVVIVQPLVPGGSAETVTLAPGTTTNLQVAGPGPGYSVRGDGDIFVAWSLTSDAGLALAVGTPTFSAGE